LSAWWGLIIPVSDLVAKTDDDEKDIGSDFDWGRPSNEQSLSERDEVRCSVNHKNMLLFESIVNNLSPLHYFLKMLM
jgi:hypothetical protein